MGNRSAHWIAWGAPVIAAKAYSPPRSLLTTLISGCLLIQPAAVSAERSGSRSRILWLVKSTRIVPNLRPRRKLQSSIPSRITCWSDAEGRVMMRRRVVVGEARNPIRLASRVPSSPLVARPMACTASNNRFVTCAHGSTKVGRRSVKIFRAQSGLWQKNLRTER